MRYWPVFIVFLFHSCATSDALKTSSVGERNVNNLYRVQMGMGEKQVLRIMRDPYHSESFQVGEDRYDVLFYVTEMTAMNQTRMVPLNLTPLTFKNQILVGQGYNYYYWLKKQSIPKKTVPQTAPKLEENSIKPAIEEAVSMSSPPKKGDQEPPPETDIEIRPKDKDMWDDESDENFDFW